MKGRLITVGATAVAIAVSEPQPAKPHAAVTKRIHSKPLEVQENVLERALAHHQYVKRQGRGRPAWWHGHATRWTRRSLGRVQSLIREAGARLPSNNAHYGSALCGPACISCESGGDPNAWNGRTYWGLFQFDYSTWVAHGGRGSEYGRAPAWRQHQVAQNVNYDAWPNC